MMFSSISVSRSTRPAGDLQGGVYGLVNGLLAGIGSALNAAAYSLGCRGIPVAWNIYVAQGKIDRPVGLYIIPSCFPFCIKPGGVAVVVTQFTHEVLLKIFVAVIVAGIAPSRY